MSSAESHSKTRLGGLDFQSPANRLALVYSFWDGIFANGMVALTETFGTAAAVRLHAPNWLIPLLTALPLLIGAAGQFILPYFTHPEKGRKIYVLLGVRLQALGFFLCGFMGFLPASMAAYAFAALFILGMVFGNSISSYWMVWISDLVPVTLRGRHFAWRSIFFAWANLSCSLIAGVVARNYHTETAPWLLFAGVFAVSGLFRFISSECIRRQGESIQAELRPAQTLWTLHRFRPPVGLTPYAISTALFQGSAALASPFFNVWFLRDLNFSYLSLAISTSCTVLGSILSLRIWGRLADKRSNLWVLRLSALLIIFIPWPYLVLHTPQSIWFVNIFGGICWGGYNLANFNCLLDVAGKERKIQSIAYASVITGISLTVFGLLGGWLADHLPLLFSYSLQSMFLVSGLLRVLFWVLLISRLKPPLNQA